MKRYLLPRAGVLCGLFFLVFCSAVYARPVEEVPLDAEPFEETQQFEEESQEQRPPVPMAWDEPMLFNLYLYVGFKVPHYTLGGGFDGNEYVTDGRELVILPKIEGNNGFGIFGGVRTRDLMKTPIDLAFEAGYSWSSHLTQWRGKSGEAYYRHLSGTFRMFMKPSKKIHPYLDVGAFMSWIIVKNGSTTVTTSGDAVFPGYGVQYGGGISYFAKKDVTLSLGATYAQARYPVSEETENSSKQNMGNIHVSGVDPYLKVEFLF